MRSCLFCDRDIRPRQEALQCDGCHRWQHRVCSTGISRAMYRATIRGDEGGMLSWYCTECGVPDVPVLRDVALIQTSIDMEPTMPYMEEPPVLELSAVPAGHRDETTLPYMDEPPVLELSAVPAGHRDEMTLPYMDEPPVLKMSAVPTGHRDETLHYMDMQPPILERSDVPCLHQPRSDRPVHPEGISDEPLVLEISVVSPIRSAVDASVVHGRLEESQSSHPHGHNTKYTVTEDAQEDLDPLEVSFDLTDQDHDDPDPIVEQSLGDAIITDTIVEEEPTTYEIVEEGTIRRARKLVSSDGYSYTVKCASKTTTTWRCSVRNRRVWCRATVSQQGTSFTPGSADHVHPPDNLVVKRIKIRKEIMETAMADVHRLASSIVEEVMQEELDDQDFNLPRPDYLVRAANHARQLIRPTEPTDLDFVIDHGFLQLPDFQIGDVRVDDQCHLLFATPNQLRVLEQAKRWYLEGTFKIRREPFQQLWSVHAFIQKDGATKQVPLCFALMSRQRTEDYEAVLQQLLHSMSRRPAVEGFVMDFETACWKAVRSVFPE